MKISYYLAIVDPPNAFVDDTEAKLTGRLRAVGFAVRGFRDAQKYIGLLAKYPYQIPLVIVADMAAIDPSVEEGIFVQTKRVVPRASCIAYTANIRRPEWQRLRDLGAIETDDDIVYRGDDDRQNRLEEIILEKVDRFRKSDDYQRLTRLCKQLGEAKKIGRSQANLLIEAARGTDKGRCLLCGSGLHEGLESLGDLKGEITMVSEPVKSPMEDLFRQGRYIWRLLRKDKLRFWERAIVEDVARYKFTALSRRDLELATSLRNFFDSEEFPADKEGWRIVWTIHEEVMRLNKKGLIEGRSSGG